EIVVETAKGGEEALNFVVPGQRLGVMPGGLALGHGECPIEKIAEVREDLRGRAGGFGGVEIGEGVGSALEDLRAAIGSGGERMAQEVASTGRWRQHRGAKLTACGGQEKVFCKGRTSEKKRCDWGLVGGTDFVIAVPQSRDRTPRKLRRDSGRA